MGNRSPLQLRQIPKEGESILGPRAKADYRIDATTGCWVWQKSTDRRGYGMTGHRRAHRLYYEVALGPIPEGFDIHHKCVNPSCVNPAHLEALHPREHDHEFLTSRGLTLDDVREIYRLRLAPTPTAKEIAEHYGIDQWTVYSYWYGKRWAAELAGEESAKVQRSCDGCGKDITDKRRSAKWCSQSCKSRGKRAKAKAHA